MDSDFCSSRHCHVSNGVDKHHPDCKSSSNLFSKLALTDEDIINSIFSRAESSPNIEPAKALRYNAGKLPLNLVPPEWTRILAEVLGAGAAKYSPNNWKQSINTADHDSFKYDRLESAKRHILYYEEGQQNDEELGLHHLAMAAWNMLVIYFYDIKKVEETPICQ